MTLMNRNPKSRGAEIDPPKITHRSASYAVFLSIAVGFF